MYRRFTRPGWIAGHLLVLVAALVCLRLSWWQWERTHDPDGTIQNLGYAVLWPIFGASFIYMWIRFLNLEAARDDADDAEVAAFAAELDVQTTAPDTPTAPEPAAGGDERPAHPGPTSRAVTLSVATVEPNADDDPELAAYNRALADLAEKDQRRAV